MTPPRRPGAGPGERGPGLGARLLFGTLVRAFPRRFRVRFGDAMEEAFQDAYRASRAAGPVRLAAFLARTTGDLLRAAVKERLDPMAETSSRRFATQRRGRTGKMGSIAQDLRFAWRSLVRRPGFTSVAVFTLALGVGGNTAIFSVVNAVLLKPLHYVDADRLVTVGVAPAPGVSGRAGAMSYVDIADLENQSPALASLVGLSTSSLTLTELGDPEVVSVTRVTKGLMETFHVAPALGRDIRAQEFGLDPAAVIVVSQRFWLERFGGRDDVVGQTVTLDGQRYQVIGVAPAGFDYPNGADLWIPREFDRSTCGRGCHNMSSVGRLADGVSLESAALQVDALARSLEEAYPGTNTGKRFQVLSIQDDMVQGVRQGLWIILGAVGIVLLIACANVANLLLVRASARTTEVAVRSALGASRGRLAAQILVESGMIAALGGVLGLALAALGVRLLPRFAGDGIPRIQEIDIDGSVLLFTLITILSVSLLFGAAPALKLARAPLREGLTGGGLRGDEPRAGARARGWLLGTEVALSAMLLVGAGLLLKSLAHLYSVDVGFETRRILRFNLSLPRSRYADLSTIADFYRTLEERLAELPGVEAVGSAWGPPLGRGRAWATVYVQGRPDPEVDEETDAAIRPVSPGWLETMRIPVLRGRSLLPSDDRGEEPVALVNETFVRENFPEEDPIGQTVRVPVSLGFGSPSWRIVGVVRDVHARGLAFEPEAQIYVPHGHIGPTDLAVTVRWAAGAPPLLPLIREEVRSLDASLPLYRIETLEEAVGKQVAPTRFYLLLVGIFAGVAATLAAVGLYGVVAYTVSRRTREIGIRVALGASAEGIVGLVVGQGMRPALLGLAVGLAGALAAGRVVEGILFGVQPSDPLILIGTALLLCVVTSLAALLPARRAARVHPVAALRAE